MFIIIGDNKITNAYNIHAYQNVNTFKLTFDNLKWSNHNVVGK